MEFRLFEICFFYDRNSKNYDLEAYWFAELLHIISVLVILHQIFIRKNAQGVSVRTWQTQCLLFLARWTHQVYNNQTSSEPLNISREFQECPNVVHDTVVYTGLFFVCSAGLIVYGASYWDPIKSTYQPSHDFTVKTMAVYALVSFFLTYLMIKYIGDAGMNKSPVFLIFENNTPAEAYKSSSGYQPPYNKPKFPISMDLWYMVLAPISLIPQAYLYRNHQRERLVFVYLLLSGLSPLFYVQDALTNKIMSKFWLVQRMISYFQLAICLYAFLPTTNYPLRSSLLGALTGNWKRILLGVFAFSFSFGDWELPGNSGSIEFKNVYESDDSSQASDGWLAKMQPTFVILFLVTGLMIMILAKAYFLHFMNEPKKTRVALYSDGFVIGDDFYSFDEPRNAEALYYLTRRLAPPGFLNEGASIRLVTFSNQVYNHTLETALLDSAGLQANKTCENSENVTNHSDELGAVHKIPSSMTDDDASLSLSSPRYTYVICDLRRQYFQWSPTSLMTEHSRQHVPTREEVLTRFEKFLLCIPLMSASLAIWLTVTLDNRDIYRIMYIWYWLMGDYTAQFGATSNAYAMNRDFGNRPVEYSFVFILVAGAIASVMFIFNFRSPKSALERKLTERKKRIRCCILISSLGALTVFFLAPVLIVLCLNLLPIMYLVYFKCCTSHGGGHNILEHHLKHNSWFGESERAELEEPLLGNSLALEESVILHPYEAPRIQIV